MPGSEFQIVFSYPHYPQGSGVGPALYAVGCVAGCGLHLSPSLVSLGVSSDRRVCAGGGVQDLGRQLASVLRGCWLTLASGTLPKSTEHLSFSRSTSKRPMPIFLGVWGEDSDVIRKDLHCLLKLFRWADAQRPRWLLGGGCCDFFTEWHHDPSQGNLARSVWLLPFFYGATAAR